VPSAGSASVGEGAGRSGSGTGGSGVVVGNGGNAGLSVGGVVSGVSGTPASAGSAGAEASAGQGGASTRLDVELHIIEPLAKHLQRAKQQGGAAQTEVLAVSRDGTRVLARSTYVDTSGNAADTGRFEEAGIWTAETGTVSLGALGDADAEGQVSPYWYTEDLSRVVGVERRSGPVDRAFSWRTGEALQELAVPGEHDALGLALSRDGKVVAVSANDTPGTNRLFRFDGAARTEIPALPGFSSIYSTYLSSDGASIIGSGRAPESCQDDCWRDFVWQAGKGTTQLETPSGAKDCGLTGLTPVGGARLVARCDVEPVSQEGLVLAEGLGWIKIGGIPGGWPHYLSNDAKAAFGTGYDLATSTDVMWRWTSGKGTELLQLPNQGKVNELNAVIAATADGKTVLVETRTPVRAVLWTPDAVQVLPLPDGATNCGAQSMSDDARIITGYASGIAGDGVLWIDGEPLVLDEVFQAAGVDLTGIQLHRPSVSHDGHSMSGSAFVDGAQRGWLARLR
jgi:uncharacterized membrane protein